MDPSKDIYKFEGLMKFENDSDELDLKQFIPRGAMIKNSQEVIAMIVYTGPDTKLAMNEGEYRAKISSFASLLNIILAINIAIMFTMAILMSQIGTRVWTRNNHPKHYYIYDAAEGEIDVEMYSFKALMSYYLLFNGLLPLDLAVTLMISKLWVIYFVQGDHHMVDFEKSCTDGELNGCEVKNMMMLEDLSKINQIFCDKTGTLTKNELIFKAMAVGSSSFEVSDFEVNYSLFSEAIKKQDPSD
jgi:magnesium-transporting ATPase (P-type)